MQGIERLKVLSSEIKDAPLLQIINYLLSREDMDEKYLNEEKSIKQMVSFIKSEAQKEAKNGMAWVEDKKVFGWAVHYWDESNKDLKLETQISEEKEETEKTVKKEVSKQKKETNKEWIPEGQISLFDL